MSYTEKEIKYIKRKYILYPTRDTVNQLALELNKSYRSIIGKLSKEGVYKRESYKTKTGETPITKVELVAIISEELGLDIYDLQGLEKSPKNALKVLCKELGREGV